MASDKTDWDSIVELHHNYVFNLAFYLSRDRYEAEDLTQETFLRAFEHLKDFRQESSIRTWLCRIAINTHKATKRRKFKHQSICIEIMPSLDQSIDPEKIIIRRELQWCIHHVLQQHVGYDYKVALILRDLNQMSYEEIAAVLEISLAAVKSRIHRARKAFRDHLIKSGCVKFMKDYSCYCEGVLEI